jgi:hypothetical protein
LISAIWYRVSPIIVTYEYHDLAGKLRYRKYRRADKTFGFERPDGQGGWIRSAKQNGGQPVMQGVERLLYRLNELREQSASSSDAFRVWITEGEKDANRLWLHGLPATTNDDGASEDGRRPKWKRALTQQLKTVGASEVVCLRDYDDAGRAHREAIAASCHAAGLIVRLVELPGEHPKGYDVSDWLDAGHNIDELVTLADAARMLCAAGARRGTAD